ncbi:MAG: hypothetical protein IPO65_18230 [Saprospiraceae bacterium]|nr:hypothetical protein [Saprospiraceae bacterium]
MEKSTIIKYVMFQLALLWVNASFGQRIFTDNEKIFIYEYILNETLLNEKETDEYGVIFYSPFHKDSAYVKINANATNKEMVEMKGLKKLLKIDSLTEHANSYNRQILEQLHSQIKIQIDHFTFERAKKNIRELDCSSAIWFSNIFSFGDRYFVLIQQLRLHEQCDDCILPYNYYEFEICTSNGLINFTKKYENIYHITNHDTNMRTMGVQRIVDLKKFECR